MVGRGVTFGGRLRKIPGAYSVVSAQVLSQKGGVGNTVAIIGNSTGGEPLAVHEFYDPIEAKNVLGSGPLLDACMMAWHPSPDVLGADKIIAIRAASSCAQGTASLLDGSGNAVVSLTTRRWGINANNIRRKVEAGSSVATYPGVKKVTVENQENPGVLEIGDDLGKAISLRYNGSGSVCAVTITKTAGVAVSLATVCTGASGDNLTLDLTKPQFSTLQKVVDYINGVADYYATLVGEGGRSSGDLDLASAVDIKSSTVAVHFPAILACVVDWFNNNSQWIEAVRSSTSQNGAPASVAWANFTNGADGTEDSAAYTAACALLQSELDVAYVVVATGDLSRQAQVLAHVEDMERISRIRQRLFTGSAAADSLATAKTNAAQLGQAQGRCAYAFPGIKRNDDADALTTYGGWAVAAMAAGMSVALHLRSALTNKAVLAGAVEMKLSQSEIEECLDAGIMTVQTIPGRGIRIVQGITTAVSGDEFYTEQSNVDIADAIVSGLETMLAERYVGQFGNASLAQNVMSDTDSYLKSFENAGCLVGDGGNSPAYNGIQVTVDAGVVSVSYNARIAGSVNYILQTASFSLGRKVL